MARVQEVTKVQEDGTGRLDVKSREGQGRGRQKTEYPLRRVAALPEETPKGSARSNLYFNMLNTIKGDEDGVGEWYELAIFGTNVGAKQALEALRNGERAVPEGEWDFEARPEVDGDGQRTGRSVLYTRFLES